MADLPARYWPSSWKWAGRSTIREASPHAEAAGRERPLSSSSPARVAAASPRQTGLANGGPTGPLRGRGSWKWAGRSTIREASPHAEAAGRERPLSSSSPARVAAASPRQTTQDKATPASGPLLSFVANGGPTGPLRGRSSWKWAGRSTIREASPHAEAAGRERALSSPSPARVAAASPRQTTQDKATPASGPLLSFVANGGPTGPLRGRSSWKWAGRSTIREASPHAEAAGRERAGWAEHNRSQIAPPAALVPAAI